MVQKFSKYKKTLSCNEDIVITDFETGEIICQKCGKVLQDKISDTRKERSFSGEDRIHTGARTSLAIHDMGLSTIIGKSNTDFVGRRLSFEMKQSMNRMRVWDSRSQTKSTSEKNLRAVLFEFIHLK